MSLRDRLLEPCGLFRGALFRDMLRERFAESDLQEGDRVGAFRIVRVLGRGGMGVVYLAERADGEFHQSVALKWLPDAGFAPEHAALFRRERQILAELTHPNIARLIDGGHTDEGHLWFAMELVEGLPIDRHAQSHALDDRARVRLILPVIEAIEFAHGRLLIHRDIKPGNVLIDSEGRPRLLDFGIATLSQDSEHALGFTPEYASPEQRALQPVGTASDVWQLGRLLETVLRIGRETPLPEDLRAIIATASADAPVDRYITTTALKYDLQRYLAHRPVQARQGGMGYRFARLLQRHPIGSLLAALGTLTLVALITGFLHYADAERERLRDARDETLAINRFLNEDVLGAGDPFVGNASDASVSDILEASLDKAERRFASHPSIAGQVQTAIGRILLGRGRYGSARLAAERATALLAGSDGKAAPSTGEARLLRATIDMHAGDPRAAQPRLEALAIDFPFDDDAPGLLQFRIQSSIGWNMMLANRADECVRIYTHLLAYTRGIPDNEIGDAYNGLSLCESSLGRFDEALRDARRSETHSVRFSGVNSGMSSLARVRIATALIGLGRHREAIDRLEREVANLTRLLGANHGTTVTYVNVLGSTHLCANDNAGAVAWMSRAVEGRRESVGANHAWTAGATAQYVLALIRDDQSDRARPLVAELEKRGPIQGDTGSRILVERALGEWHLRHGDAGKAVMHYRSARDLVQESVERFRSNLHSIEAGYGLSLARAGRMQDARAAYDRSVAAKPFASHCTSPLTIDAEADRQRLLAGGTSR